MTRPAPAAVPGERPVGPDRLLVVEDDVALREVLARGLREADFEVVTARDGGTAMRLADPSQTGLVYTALVLDVGLPDTDGRDLCQALRARGVLAPVLFLTAADTLPDRLSGYAAGGDDYLVKPFHLAELVARLRALLRRAAVGRPAGAGVRLDRASHSLVSPAGEHPLTPIEFRVLQALMAADGAVLRRRELARAGWSDAAGVQDNTLDQYIARLRRKLDEAGATETIVTARGLGYRYA